MIWIDFNPQRGAEMKDEHPVLVLSSAAFNERTGIVIGLPMTHAAANETNPFAVNFTSAKGETGYVLTHQPKSFDWRIRGGRPHSWKQLPDVIFESVCEGLNSIISIGA